MRARGWGRRLRPLRARGWLLLLVVATVIVLVGGGVSQHDPSAALLADVPATPAVPTAPPALAADPSPGSPGAAETSGAAEATGSGVLALDAGSLESTPDAAAGDYVVMQPWEYARIPALRAENPDVKILMYKDGSATVNRPAQDGRYPTGVSYAQAEKRGWFLTDADGNQQEWSDWSGLYPMNIADPGYQRTWTRNVLRELQAHDWDGVMIDDTLTTLSHTTTDGQPSTQIPTDDAMYQATDSFLSYTGPSLKTAGYLAVPNVTVDADNWTTALSDWTPYVSGWENEYFAKSGTDDGYRLTGEDWQWKADLAAWCADRGVPLLAISYGADDDVLTQTYARASWLLTWNGRDGANIFVPTEADVSHWIPGANASIGAPLAPQEVLPDGLHVRRYSRGLVVVNPTDAALDVEIPAAYRTGWASGLTTTRLEPATGALLGLA